MDCTMPLFMLNHTVQPKSTSEPCENKHYIYDHEKDQSKWLIADMGTTVTTCGKANRVDDTQND